MTLFPYEPSRQWTRSQVSSEHHKVCIQPTFTDFEQKNYSQVTFQVPDSEENLKLPVIKTDNMVKILALKIIAIHLVQYFSTSLLLPILLPQISREREKFLKLKQKPKAKKMI